MTESNSVPVGAVVVGHDGSHHADRALTHAIRFAELFGAPLVVARAWQLDADMPAYTRILAVDPNMPDLAVDIRTSLVDDCAQQVAQHPGLPVEYRVELGGAAAVLSDLSESARLLVVGSRGLGGLSGLLLGSVTTRCLHQAACPVLVVHDGTAEHEETAGAGHPEDEAGVRQLADVRPGSVVVGHDGSAESDRAFETALQFAEVLKVPVDVIRCWTIDDQPAGLLWRDGHVLSFDAASETVRSQLDADVSEIASRHPSVSARRIGTLGDPGETLTRVAANAALLVIGRRGRGGFRSLILGSVSGYCAHRASCPTVVVPHVREPR